MKKLISIIMSGLLFVNALGLLAVVEKAEPLKPKERIEEPKTSEEAEKFKERTEQTEEEIQERNSRIEANKAKLEGPQISAQEKQTIQEQLSADQSYVDASKAMIDEAKATLNKPAVKELLAAAYERPTIPESFIYSKENFDKALGDKAGVDSVRDWVDANFKIEDIKGDIDKAAMPEEKFKLIDAKRSRVQEMRDAVEAELAKKGITEERKDALEQLKKVFDQTQEDLDGLSLQIDEEQIPFFTKLARGIRNWFDKTFEFHKTSAEKRSIDVELQRIEQGRNALQSADRIRLYEDVNEYTKGANDLVVVIKGTPDEFMPGQIEGYVTRVKKIIDTINTLQEKLKQDEALKHAYDDLQKLSGELVAKEKRYKGDSPTLFESELDAYQKELVGSNFQANQMYETLGFTPEEVATITNELIDAKYQNIAKQVVPGVRSPQERAARNASTILKDPVAKATYDAFLRDWNNLKDPTKLSAQDRNWLKTQGDLKKLEITEETYNRIQQAKREVLSTMSKVGLEVFDKNNLSEKLDQIRKDLGVALAQAQEVARQQAGGLPPD